MCVHDFLPRALLNLFQIHKESPSGYFTVWGYIAFFPDRSLLRSTLGWSTGLESGCSPCLFCKRKLDSSFGILNVHKNSKGTWWLICSTGQSWHKNCTLVQQDCTQSPWQKSHCMRLTTMWQQPPAEDFYDLILGTVSLFSFINSTIKSNFFKGKKINCKRMHSPSSDWRTEINI